MARRNLSKLEVVPTPPKQELGFAPGTEIGVSGLKHFGGYIYEEILRELQGTRGLKNLKEFSENDPIAGAILRAAELQSRSPTWSVVPFSQDQEDRMRAEYLQQCLFDDMESTWQGLITEFLSMLVYGWSWVEVVYKKRGGDVVDPTLKSKFNDGLWGIRVLAPRSQDSLMRWELDDTGRTLGMWQSAPPRYANTYLPIELVDPNSNARTLRSLHFRTTLKKGNPEGYSILRNAWTSYYFSKNIKVFEGIGIERNLAGLPITWGPINLFLPTATAAEKATLGILQDIAQKTKRDELEGLTFPLAYDDKGNKLYDFTLLNNASRMQIDTNLILARYDQYIAQSALANFITTGTQRVGALNLFEGQSSFFSQAVDSYLDEPTTQINNNLVPALWKLNGWPLDRPAQLQHSKVEQVSLTEITELIKTLAGTKYDLFGDPVKVQWFEHIAGIPSQVATQEG